MSGLPTSLFCVAKCFARGATAPQLHNQSRLLFPALACCMMPKAMCKIFRGHQSSSVRFKHCSEKLAFVFCSSNVKASVFKADGPFYASSHEWKHGLVSIGLLACGVAKGVLQLLGGGQSFACVRSIDFLGSSEASQLAENYYAGQEQF